MEILLQPQSWVALLTLTFLEIVLGVYNIIFISIVSNKLPADKQAKARNIGLSLALIFRIGLLLGITWIITFTQPLFIIFDHAISGRDLILMVGGLFLMGKSTMEIHHKMEVHENPEIAQKQAGMTAVITQIVALDIIFSFDSILTAIGLTDQVILMIIAVVISLGIMIRFSGNISSFIAKHPSLEILALSFLILIGFMLMIEAFGQHVPKGYIYFAVFFSLVVEVLNMRIRKASSKVKLSQRVSEKLKSD